MCYYDEKWRIKGDKKEMGEVFNKFIELASGKYAKRF